MNFKILILQCLALLQSVIRIRAGSFNCHEVINVDDEIGTLKSPGYPKNYPDEANCTWILTAPENSTIELKFLASDMIIDLKDSVDVYDGSTIFASRIGYFSGKIWPRKLYSTSNTMTIQFLKGDGSYWNFEYDDDYRRTSRLTGFTGFSASFMKDRRLKFVSKPIDVEILSGSNQTVNMTCRVTGFPTPQINWTHNGVAVVTGNRFTIQPNGDLKIMDVQYGDGGTYTCHAEHTSTENTTDFIDAAATLTVRNRTIIKRDYASSSAHRFTLNGKPVRISCTVTEYDRMLSVSTEWRRDGARIDPSSDGRISIVHRNFKQGRRMITSELTIKNISAAYAGLYSCVARTRMDEHADGIMLRALSKPSPPIVKEVQCGPREAIVYWRSKINATSFTIQYNTSVLPDVWVTAAENIPAHEEEYEVPLSPWQNYTFRILARNEAGFSDPSEHFPLVCRADQDVPKKNPDNVTVQRIGSTELMVISWTPLSLEDHQGPQLYYEVWWKPNILNRSWASLKVINWNEGDCVVYAEPTPQEYEVFVLARNVNGVAVQPAQKVYLRSCV